jgi:DNA processing protein
VPVPQRAEAWLGLVLARGLGPKRLAGLEAALGSPTDWIEADDRQLADAGLDRDLIGALRKPDPAALERCLKWLENERHFLITRDDPLFPPLLRRIPDPPVALFALGNPACLVRPQLAIVGSRNATPGGIDHARSFGATLARSGFVVTSGLAAGVDGAAHQGCLDAGGQTIAVAGTGLDQVYPARHRDLARRIAGQGVLISQFPPGTGPLAGNFPARNRVISGMSLGTLVIEAGLRSGSLITARLASEQGRDVFAIPGSVHNPQARGCHRLIRDGAKLVETAEEVAEELGPLARQLAEDIEHLLAPRAADSVPALEESPGSPHIEDDPEYQRLLEAIGFDPTPVDDIIQRSRLTPAAVSSMLLMLELDGRVSAHAGGRYSRNA